MESWRCKWQSNKKRRSKNITDMQLSRWKMRTEVTLGKNQWSVSTNDKIFIWLHCRWLGNKACALFYKREEISEQPMDCLLCKLIWEKSYGRVLNKKAVVYLSANLILLLKRIE